MTFQSSTILNSHPLSTKTTQSSTAHLALRFFTSAAEHSTYVSAISSFALTISTNAGSAGGKTTLTHKTIP
eukprot:m.11650 g.11650  ORF g.11650 m.11650 type:complete len:71 (-) comp5754_c1_seq1:1145-1357(-)